MKATTVHNVGELDALRGVAIALVFVFHCEYQLNGLNAFRHTFGPWKSYVLGGDTGVSLFFLLSGFLIGRPFLCELRGGTSVSIRDYAARRFLRIMPLYGTFVALGTLMSASAISDIWSGLPYLFFLNGFYRAMPLSHWSLVWWSLATEVQFYVLLPLMVWLLAHVRIVGVAMLGMLVLAYVALVTSIAQAVPLDLAATLTESVLGRAPLFACGIIGAHLYKTRAERWRQISHRQAFLRAGGADVLLVGMLAAFGYALRRVVLMPHWHVETRRPYWHIGEGVFWLAVTLAVLVLPLRTKGLLVNRFWKALGLLSYSIYLVHVPVLLYVKELVFEEEFPGWNLASGAALVAITAATLAISTCTYLLIERPFLTRKSRIGAPSTTTSADSGLKIA